MRLRRSTRRARARPAALQMALAGGEGVMLGAAGLTVELAAADRSTTDTLLDLAIGLAIGGALIWYATRRTRRGGGRRVEPLPSDHVPERTVRTVVVDLLLLLWLGLLGTLLAPETAAIGGVLLGWGVFGLLEARDIARLETERGERLFLAKRFRQYYAAPNVASPPQSRTIAR